MPLDGFTLATINDFVGKELGVSDWLTVDQQKIDAFAQITGDHQWIHVDVARAQRESPFGTTIAHGNLTLSLIDGLREQLSPTGALDQAGIVLGVNLGWNRVRYPAPVPA